MEITIAGQTWIFFMAVLIGALIGVCYDIFRILRVAIAHSPWAVMLEDIFFSILCATATFVFLLSCDSGQIRVFALLGELIGFLLYHYTVGALVIGLSKWLIDWIRRIFVWIGRILFEPIFKISSNIYHFCSLCCGRMSYYLKKKTKNSKIYLKKQRDLLYNQRKQVFAYLKKKSG